MGLNKEHVTFPPTLCDALRRLFKMVETETPPSGRGRPRKEGKF